MDMSTETNNIPLGQPLTLKELCELHGWTYVKQTKTIAKLEKQLGELYDYEITGKGKGKRYVLHEVKIVNPAKESDSRHKYNKQGKLVGVGKTNQQDKKSTKKSSKTYTDYVYTGQQDVPLECLVPLTKEDEERHNRYVNMVKVGTDYTQKELVLLFNEEEKQTGTQKQKQLSTWWQSFEWEETKRAGKPTLYTVTKVFDKPRQRIDYKQELTNFKEQSLEVNFILSILNSKNLHEEVSDYGLITGIKAREFYVNMGLVNRDYYHVRSQKGTLSDWLSIEEQNVIYRDIDESAKRYTMGALKRLHKQRVIIDYSYTYIWIERDGEEHLATDKEHLAIENAIQETIKYAQEIGFDKVKSVINLYDNTLKDFQQQDLLNHLQELIRQDIPQFDYYYRAYKLVYLKEPMKRYVNTVANKEGLEVSELGILKRDSSHKEHTQIQIGKVNKRHSENKDKKTKLINTVVDLPREGNTSDREEVIGKIKREEEIDSLVERGEYSQAEELIFKV